MIAALQPVSLAWVVAAGFGAGAVLAAAAHVAAAALGTVRRPSPWLVRSSGIAARIPIVGWLFLSEGPPAYRARCAAVELLAGVVFALWSYQSVVQGALVSADYAAIWSADLGRVVQPLVAQAILFGLMLAASLIDFEEKIIPDAITVPGTWAGLILAAALPGSLLPVVDFSEEQASLAFDFVRLSSPHPWPSALEGRQWPSLALGALCWGGWCFALLPRTWYTRHGLLRAVVLCWARVRREPASRTIAVMAVVGTALIAGVWLLDGRHWHGLLTALTGMAVGGAMIWVVRAVGGRMLGREAMGFGDVTLMAMIGAFLGWQACLPVFFFAPIAGLIVGGLHWLVRRDHEVPYGPFLCLAAAVVVVRWPKCWAYLADVLALGWFLLWLAAASILLLIALLWLLRAVRGSPDGN